MWMGLNRGLLQDLCGLRNGEKLGGLSAVSDIGVQRLLSLFLHHVPCRHRLRSGQPCIIGSSRPALGLSEVRGWNEIVRP
jgi:hypothetical protein